jgi:hypothetical protein
MWEHDGVRLVKLLDDPCLAVLPKRHRPAARRSVEPRELAEEPWVGSEWPGPCLDAQLDVCMAAGFRPRFVVESEDYVTAQGFVAAGLGVSLISPGSGRPPSRRGRAGRTGLERARSIYAAVRGTAPPQPALREFLEALRDAGRRRALRQRSRNALKPGYAFVGSNGPPAPRVATSRGSAYGIVPYQSRATVKPKARHRMPPTASSQKWLAVATMTVRVTAG